MSAIEDYKKAEAEHLAWCLSHREEFLASEANYCIWDQRVESGVYRIPVSFLFDQSGVTYEEFVEVAASDGLNCWLSGDEEGLEQFFVLPVDTMIY